MFFSSPIWLLGLLPWAAVVVWMLRGRPEKVFVPFVLLWRGMGSPSRVRHAVQPPPLMLAAALAAAGLAVVAAAGPVLSWPQRAEGPHLTIIVDRGITMSAWGSDHLRYIETATMAQEAILRTFGPGPMDLISVPDAGRREASRQALAALVGDLPPTAMDTADALRALVENRLMATEDLILLLSDQALGIDEPRLIQIAPPGPLENVGITDIAVRQAPRAQAMVRVENQSSLSSAVLRVETDGEAIERDIELPARGEDALWFIDLPAIGQVVTALVQVEDDLVADNQAWLVRKRTWPQVEPAAPLPEALVRVIEVYQRLRPAGEGSVRVAVARDVSDLAANEPGVVVAAEAMRSLSSVPGEDIGVEHRPVTAEVDWQAAVVQAAAAAPRGWTPLVRAGERTVVAAMDDPVRRVWVGFDMSQWSHTADFVVFWSNVFNWLSEGGEAFAAHPVAPLGAGWQVLETSAADTRSAAGLWPGVYQREDGTWRAVNAPRVRMPSNPPDDWRAQLAALQRQSGGGTDARPWVLVAALGLLTLAACAWPRAA